MGMVPIILFRQPAFRAYGTFQDIFCGNGRIRNQSVGSCTHYSVDGIDLEESTESNASLRSTYAGTNSVFSISNVANIVNATTSRAYGLRSELLLCITLFSAPSSIALRLLRNIFDHYTAKLSVTV
jgi:hypothetical protein